MTIRMLPTALVTVVLAVLTGACGGGDDGPSGEAGGAARRIEVVMVDNAFEPATLEVAKGEAVRFVFTNEGEVPHEAYVGTRDEQADHEQEMAGDAEGADGHDHGGGGGDARISVDPGEHGELTYRFDEAGTYEVGCHEPGHYEAGMKITVDVA